MEMSSQIKIASSVKRQRGYLILFSALLLVSNIGLTIGILTRDRTVLLVPTNITKEIEIGSQFVSDDYLELLARDFVQTFMNVAPNAEEYVTKYLLKIAHPSFYGELKLQLADFFEEIKTKQLTLQFLLSDMEIDNKAMTVKVSGKLIKRIGSSEVENNLRHYVLGFHKNGLVLNVIEFYEVKSDRS